MICPRCGQPCAKGRFYGPCEGCQDELRDLKPPEPDPNFVPATFPNGLPTTSYVGPRVDRCARGT